MKFAKRLISVIMCILLVVMVIPMNVIVAKESDVEILDSSPFAGGDGSSENPYVISTSNQLNCVRDYLDKSFILSSNIDLSSFDNWTPIGSVSAPFTGVLDGNGYVVSNVTINNIIKTMNYVADMGETGFFGHTKNAVIKNLGIENAKYTITSEDFASETFSSAGGFACTIENTIIEKCYFEGSISNNVGKNVFSRVGGIAAIGIDSNVNNCYSNASLYANAYNMNTMVAGIVPWLDGTTLDKCYVAGSVIGENTTGYSYVGGFNASGNASSFWGIITSYGGTVKNSVYLLDTLTANGVKNVVDNIGSYSSHSNNLILVSDSKEAFEKSTYESLGWDFNYTWKNTDALPLLRVFSLIRDDLDTDGDGLSDNWEINGADVDGDGVIDVDLKNMGADPNVPDVFVEVDWMVRPEEKFLFWSTQKHRNLAPSENSLRLVYESFKEHGINIHIDAGPNSVDFVTGNRWGGFSEGNELPYEESFNLNNWNDVISNNFSINRSFVFRYCMFVDRYGDTTSSGIAAGIPGQCFIVANQDWVYEGGDTSVAGTFMHELGHTLGLKHGGCDHIGYKPNYLSIMNYLFQTTGLVGTGAINYSDYKLPDLDESTLNENFGIDPHRLTSGSILGTAWYNDGVRREIVSISGAAIDFNGNGIIEERISIDLNNNVETILRGGYNDWENIEYKAGEIGKGYYSGIEVDTYINDFVYEKTLEESLSTNTLAPEGSATIELISDILFVDLAEQRLLFNVYNRTNKEIKLEFLANCPELFESYSTSIVVGKSENELEYTRIEMPIEKVISEGEYYVHCTLMYNDRIVYQTTIDVSAIRLSDLDVEMVINSIENGDINTSQLDDDLVNQIKDSFIRSCLLGDANGDDKVNVKDATEIQKAVAGLLTLEEAGEGAADADGSGTVNVKDATAIQKWVAGIETGFLIGEPIKSNNVI